MFRRLAVATNQFNSPPKRRDAGAMNPNALVGKERRAEDCPPCLAPMCQLWRARRDVPYPDAPVGRFLVGGSAGAPTALLPHVNIGLLHAVGLLDPFAWQPHIARMRARPPVAGHPNPLAAPGPVAGNEPPLRQGAWWRGNNIFLIRRRRLGGLTNVGAVRRGDLWPNGNRTIDRATRRQQQAGGHQETFEWNRFFHGFKFGTSRANFAHFPKNATD